MDDDAKEQGDDDLAPAKDEAAGRVPGIPPLQGQRGGRRHKVLGQQAGRQDGHPQANHTRARPPGQAITLHVLVLRRDAQVGPPVVGRQGEQPPRQDEDGHEPDGGKVKRGERGHGRRGRRPPVFAAPRAQGHARHRDQGHARRAQASRQAAQPGRRVGQPAGDAQADQGHDHRHWQLEAQEPAQQAAQGALFDDADGVGHLGGGRAGNALGQGKQFGEDGGGQPAQAFDEDLS